MKDGAGNEILKRKFKVLGVNSEKDFCQCCGKRGLMRVVWIQDVDTGEIMHYGTICVLSINKEFRLSAQHQIKSAIKADNKLRLKLENRASTMYGLRGGKWNLKQKPDDIGLYAQCLFDAEHTIDDLFGSE